MIENMINDIRNVGIANAETTKKFYEENKYLITPDRVYKFLNKACQAKISSFVKPIFSYKWDLVYIDYLKLLQFSKKNNDIELIKELEERANIMSVFYREEILRRDRLDILKFIDKVDITFDPSILMESVQYTSMRSIKFLVEKIDIKDDDDVIYEAIGGEDNSVFHILIKYADITKYSSYIKSAISHNNLDIVKYCTEHYIKTLKLDDASTYDFIIKLLSAAINSKNEEMMLYFIDTYDPSGIYLDAGCVFMNLIDEKNETLIEFLESKYIICYETDLMYAIQCCNDINIFLALLRGYEDFEINEYLVLLMKLLLIACEYDNIDVITHLTCSLYEEGNPDFGDAVKKCCYNANYHSAYYIITEYPENTKTLSYHFIDTILVKAGKMPVFYKGNVPPATECGICMLEINEKEELIKCDKCTKLTHYSCYKKWMKNCIYCRN